MSDTEIKARLKEWILRRAKAPAGRTLEDDAPILAAGLLSSLDVVELILYIESLRGDEVDIETIEPAVLSNVDTLYEGFFGAAGVADAKAGSAPGTQPPGGAA
jgi:acyl carrier protein